MNVGDIRGLCWKAARLPLESFLSPDMDLSLTASKLDASLGWFPALADQAALTVLHRIGIGVVLERNARLAIHLRNALEAKGVGIRSFPEPHGSTIFYNLEEELARVAELIAGR
ncbi:hypothetical protein R5O87_12175 [Arthrobacter globiformis]|uniref:hypothetical protein n=1 Tax=Arthrobacter globiformis TaxID=1665 RepID=UPI00397C86D5